MPAEIPYLYIGKLPVDAQNTKYKSYAYKLKIKIYKNGINGNVCIFKQIKYQQRKKGNAQQRRAREPQPKHPLKHRWYSNIYLHYSPFCLFFPRTFFYIRSFFCVLHRILLLLLLLCSRIEVCIYNTHFFGI